MRAGDKKLKIKKDQSYETYSFEGTKNTPTVLDWVEMPDSALLNMSTLAGVIASVCKSLYQAYKWDTNILNAEIIESLWNHSYINTAHVAHAKHLHSVSSGATFLSWTIL